MTKEHTIEAYGVKGMQSRQWRKTFKHSEHLNDWADKNDAQVLGTRDLEEAKHGNLSPSVGYGSGHSMKAHGEGKRHGEK